MTTYRKYNPEKDVLKEGMRIRLAGRIGQLLDNEPYHEVLWDDRKHERCHYRDLRYFPDLEIAEEPLRISKRLKKEIKRRYDLGSPEFENAHRFMDWINSLEVTD